ncbi:MAG: GNAT family N-acetyltransferase [Actinobacteria bacterium]|nr:GNAT family N-acetyltransferase [Actinomycetota bacterium]
MTPARAARPYAGEGDLRAMRRLLLEGRAGTGDWHYPHVGLLAWDFFMVVCHLDPQQHVHLWHDSEGRLMAYALLGEDPMIDWQVGRGHEWSGVEAEALAWAEERVAVLRCAGPERWGGPLAARARQDDPRRVTFLEGHGFRYRGEFTEVDMIRSLGGSVPEAVVPEGFRVRGVSGPEEASERASAEREVWLPATVGEIDGDDYARLMRLPGYRRELDVVAVASDGTIAAYVNCWLDPVNRIGNFGPVGARPAFRRRGLTRAVLLEGMRRLQAAGMDRVCVSTGEANHAARCLYESVGFAVVDRCLDYVKAPSAG